MSDEFGEIMGSLFAQVNRTSPGDSVPDWLIASAEWWAHYRGSSIEDTLAWLEANGRQLENGSWILHVGGQAAIDRMRWS